MSFVAAIVGLALLVLIHEAGHFFAAKGVGMRPRKFYLGFGTPLVKTVRGGVEYGIGALPLGGYVRFAGDMNPASQPSPEWLSLPPAERARTFQAKPLWQRAIIVAAGPVMNFLIAIAILGGFAVAFGENVTQIGRAHV